MSTTKKEDKYTLFKIEHQTLSADVIKQLKAAVKKANDNIIVDASEIVYCLDEDLLQLQNIYESQLKRNKSFIIANLTDDIMDQADEADIELNVVPTLNEAVDLLFMEELEREL